MNKTEAQISVRGLTVAYGDFVLLKNADFDINKGDVFIIMGASGGRQKFAARVLTGLVPAASGRILIDGVDFTAAHGKRAGKDYAKMRHFISERRVVQFHDAGRKYCPAAAPVYRLFR